MVRYTVKSDQAAHNEALIRAVFTELHRIQPPGLRYAAFKLDDDVSFMHLVWSDPQKGHSPVAHLPALKDFHAGIRDRCDEPPLRTKLSEIGYYRLFDRG